MIKDIEVRKIINDKVNKLNVQVYFESDLLIMRGSVNSYKYSICLNKGCMPVLLSLNNKRVGERLCKYVSDNYRRWCRLSDAKGILAHALFLKQPKFFYSIASWTSHD